MTIPSGSHDHPDEVSERLANYNVTSEKVIGDIISLYFDILDRGEVEDVCGNDDSFDD